MRKLGGMCMGVLSRLFKSRDKSTPKCYPKCHPKWGTKWRSKTIEPSFFGGKYAEIDIN